MPYKQGWETLVNNPLFHHRNNNIQQATLNSESRLFALSPSLHFTQKPWKLRGKVVSLQKKSCTRQIESKLSLRSFAFSSPPNSLKKNFVYVKLGLKIMNLCESVGDFLCPGLAASAFTFPQ